METEILASTILSTFEQARIQLIGKSVVLADGKAGTVENVWLDELHGLRSRSRATMGSGLSPPLKSRRGSPFSGIFPARQSGGSIPSRDSGQAPRVLLLREPAR
jgi:hypothetical protein